MDGFNLAEFEHAFKKMIQNEGGFVLHKVPGDRGGLTYAGISKRYHPEWPGWDYIGKKEIDSPEITPMVRQFYKEKYWNKIKGDEITEQTIAETIFDFAVNAGTKTSIKLAQVVVSTIPDGVLGPKTLAKINSVDPEKFSLAFFSAKITRYAQICSKNPSQKKFLLGWINRSLKGVS